MRLPLVALIRFYQLVISPLFPRSCRFYPTCSQYALVAISEHGALRGSWLAIARLGRCHPWNPGGVDYVPAPRNSSAKGTHSCI
jgi:putative membrane protein insertion efficiency factor